MCTLGVLHRPGEPWPLVVAANRDEQLSRPASAPFIWEREGLLAPRDDTAGGTWLGLNRHGVFVGVTNRFGAPPDRTRASRGTLVLEALAAPSAERVGAALAGLNPTRFNPFHLVYADAHHAGLTWSDGVRVQHQVLPPGLHVFTERSLGGDDRARADWVRAEFPVEPDVRHPEPLFRLLAHHAESPLEGTCVHAPAFGYGTRSSLVLMLSARLQQSHFWWAEGPPCQVPHQDRSELVRALALSR